MIRIRKNVWKKVWRSVMDTLQLVHVSVEIWGSFFSLSFAVLVFVTRRFEPVAARQLMAMLMTNTAALGSDVLAWLFRGDSSMLGYYMVCISNFCRFLFLFLVMAAMSGYLSYLVKCRSGKKYCHLAIYRNGDCAVCSDCSNCF